MELVDIGFGNVANKNRVLCIVGAESAPSRRIVSEARDRGILIDACSGKKCRAVIIMDSDHIVTSALEVTELRERFS